jgi:glucose/arabinose dehydrogenase/cytochrome c551/c552/type 1 glutamine amidotransferase
MNKHINALAAFIIVVFLFSCNKREGRPKVLVFTKTAAYYHQSIPAGVQAIIKLGTSNGFDVDTTSDADKFNDDNLKNYSTVVFLNTTGDVLNYLQQVAFERYIQAGGGYVGIHSATDTEYDWGWYGRLVGAYFNGHPEIQQATLNVKDNQHISTKHLPANWIRTDEWYNFKKISNDIHVLITIDEKSYKGGTNGDNHPMAWYHEFDGGRAFYTELGHREQTYSEPLYLQHILGGILYAIGDNKLLDYGDAESKYPPDEDRFTKTVLVQGSFFEPTEMTILPNLDILVVQRRGDLALYKNDSKKLVPAGSLKVYWKAEAKGVNAEEGLLGIQADPDFKKNHWVYIFYSPIDTSVNRLSRFEFKNDKLDLNSEKIILQFYSQREICCHTGGSVAFGPDRMLFLSAGDNSTPFDEPNQRFVNHGFAPLNDLPGHEQYDARRSSGNSNDLRGKVMRIKIKEDGTYEIPEGNLFAKGTPNTRPEIFVMGDRNPYRISVDKKNGYLYWGEVGPDAGKDSFDTRGPRGYDEVNQAKKAGFFGWPLFVGNNYPYHEYDYATGATGALFDPAKPVNNSRNNTGIKNLPPAQPAFIWYPYDASPDFPEVGTGGRNAMAGPVYYTDMFPENSRYPDYYNGKLFIYEWIRGWVKVVSMIDGNFDKMEPFMEHTKFSNPIDMEVGPDGKLYVLEYGTGWFTKNPDAALSRIDYNSGNRAPQIASIKVNKTSGKLPFKVAATVDAKDPEKEPLTYRWDFGNGTKKETKIPEADYTYSVPGEYAVSVAVIDSKGDSTESSSLNIYAGNEEPVVDIDVSNKTFYFPGKPVKYAVKVEGADTSIDASNLMVIADYVEGTSKQAVPLGHLSGAEAVSGKNIMLMNDCKACHKENDKSIGPSFMQVSMRYKNNPKAPGYLIDKIKKGGSGVWGETAMSAHPDLPTSDIQQIVQWVLSLSQVEEKKKSLPPSGTLKATLNKLATDNGLLYITASYTNKAEPGIKSLTGKRTLVLRNNKVTFEGLKNFRAYSKTVLNGVTYLVPPKDDGWFAIDTIDLTGISVAELTAGSQKDVLYGYDFEIRLDNPAGKKIGAASFAPLKAKEPSNIQIIRFNLETVNDNKFHNLYIVSKSKDSKESADIGLQSLKLISK